MKMRSLSTLLIKGIVISFTGYKPYNFIKYNEDTLNQCYIIIDQMSDPQNLGQIIRTSECAGIDGIILPQHGSVHITDTVLQVSQGAFIHSKIFIVNNLTQMIKEMQDNGFWIVGVENSIDAKNWHQIDFKGKIGIFEIDKKTITHQLNFYVIENKEIKKIF